MPKPVIFLAFSNERDAYLPTINRERKNIVRTLRRHHDAGLIQVEAEASSTLEDIFEVINRYDQQIAIFHYGGHAGASSLQLEDSQGNAQEAFAGGLAQFLGQQESLQLVFLNGCATGGQVEQLLTHGVKAVIATSVPIEDKMATEFAEQFYHAIASHNTIDRAFRVAKAFVEAKYLDAQDLQMHRGIDWISTEEINAKIPWGLYLSAKTESSLQWQLPRNVSQKQVIRTRFDYESRPDVNDILIDVICEEIAIYNPDLDNELNKEKLDIPSIKREIVDSFPTPIGEHLRKLFARSNDPKEPDEMELFSLARAKQLVVTYRTSVQFICFTLLSQLWDVKYKMPEIEIGEEFIVDFNSFFTLNRHNFESFNYVKLINTITDIFDVHKIPYFIEELQNLKIDASTNLELYNAHIFMNSLSEDFQTDNVPNDETESLCLEGEEHLAIVLKAIAFLVKYKLVTIKNIEIIKNRHEIARYRHNQITLNRALTVASTGTAEVGVEFNNFTDNKSVIFIKTLKNEVSDFLNLTPFIIDENALNSDYSSKLYLYAYEEEKSYHYQFLNNLLDKPMKVNANNYPNIKFQFDRFRAEIFGLTYKPVKQKPTSGGESRFSRKR